MESTMRKVEPKTSIDLVAVKARQRVTWAAGDYAIIGTTLQIVGESLCEAADVRGGERVLDVACGNGNAALAAARRFAEVTGVDYVPSLLERARARAEADGLPIDFREADAEQLPFGDGEFDVVLSTFGCMFTPNQEDAAAELLRLCRRGGRIGLANWTPDGFVGQLFRIIGRYVPPPAGLRSPSEWGSEARVRELFGSGVSRVEARRASFVFRYRSAEHWLDVFRRYYGPVHKAFEALGEGKREELAAEIGELLQRGNRASDALVVPSEYLEIVLHVA